MKLMNGKIISAYCGRGIVIGYPGQGKINLVKKLEKIIEKPTKEFMPDAKKSINIIGEKHLFCL